MTYLSFLLVPPDPWESPLYPLARPGGGNKLETVGDNCDSLPGLPVLPSLTKLVLESPLLYGEGVRGPDLPLSPLLGDNPLLGEWPLYAPGDDLL